MSTITTTEDVYQPTRLEDVKWRVGNRINVVADALYERLTRLGDSLTGDGHETLEEQARLNYRWGHKMATSDAAKMMATIVRASQGGGQR